MTITYDVDRPAPRTSAIFEPCARSYRVTRLPESYRSPRFQVHRDESRSRVEALTYIARCAKRLLSEGAITSGTALRALHGVVSLNSPMMVYPHISAADGEFSALWLAGKSTIELSIPEHGQIYVRTTDVEGVEELVGFFDTLPVAHLRTRLRRLTEYVEHANPNWLQVFER